MIDEPERPNATEANTRLASDLKNFLIDTYLIA